ncbi:MAG: M20 family metallopeptidase [Pseudomonadota bacterium]
MPPHRLDPLFHADLDGLRTLRRHLHANPELSWEEQGTQHVLRTQLEGLGFEPRVIAGTGLVVDTRPDLPVAVALRADIDALPMQEETGLPYASVVPGCMHACGHDGHMAILVGVARALARAAAPVNARLIFQPAEEGGLGAARVIREGALEGVPEIYGLHNWPALPTGTAAVAQGPVMGASRLFEAVFHGRGGHGSQPQVTADPILAAAHFVTTAQAVVSRLVHPLDPAVVSFGAVQGGTKGNIIPDTVRLLGTLRCLDDALMERMEARLQVHARAAAEPLGVRAELSFHAPYPATVNGPAGAARVRQVIAAGAQPWEGPSPFPCMGAEDFALYLQQLPGAYFFLGSGHPDGSSPGIHRADYDFDDEAVPVGIRLFLLLVEAIAGIALSLPSEPAEAS